MSNIKIGRIDKGDVFLVCTDDIIVVSIKINLTFTMLEEDRYMTEREHKLLLGFACLCLLLLIFRVRGYIGGPLIKDAEPVQTAAMLNSEN